WHRVHTMDYAYDGAMPGYRLDDPATFTTHVPPGTYDVLYARAYTGAESGVVHTTPPSDVLPHGLRFIGQVVLDPGVNSVTLDIPPAPLSGTVTRAGSALPQRSPSPYELDFFLFARDTRAAQRVHLIDYAYDGAMPGYLLDDAPTYTTSVVPGVYDIL